VTAIVNDVEIAYTDSGVGRPLLCLHGGMGIDGASLRVPGIVDLSARGVRVIVPDQRGHGRSAAGDPRDYTHATWVADVRGLLARLGIARAALLGHSYGGFLALEYAIRWPESLTHLILVGTSAGPVHASTAAVADEEGVRERFRAAWPHFFAGEEKQWPLFDALTFSAAPYNAAFTRELPRYDLRGSVRSIAVPTLLVVGRHDHYRAAMEWLAGELPVATLHVIDAAGHLPFVERAAEFTQAVGAFLATS
jgi:proline iminopeptidase